MAMVRRVFKWLVNLFTGHTVLQLIATVPTAYLTGLALQFQQEAEAVFSAIPPLFWPVLAILVLAVTVYPGFALRVKPISSWNSPRLLMAYAAFFFDVVVSIFSSRFIASRSLGRCR